MPVDKPACSWCAHWARILVTALVFLGLGTLSGCGDDKPAGSQDAPKIEPKKRMPK